MIPLKPLRCRSIGVSPFGASAKRLTNCTVRLRDATLSNCVLAPLFDAEGVTAKVVLLSARTRECWVLDWRPELVYVPWWRVVRLDVPRSESQRVAGGDPLWLFDSSGLVELGIASLCGRAVARNAASVVPKTVIAPTWRRDLSRIAGVWSKKRGGGQELNRWKRDWLSDASAQPDAATPAPIAEAPFQPEAAGPGRAARGWVLDPIWM